LLWRTRPGPDPGASRVDQYCAHCHGPNATQGERPRDLRRLKLRYRDEAAKMFYEPVNAGRPDVGMPPLEGRTGRRRALAHIHLLADRTDTTVTVRRSVFSSAARGAPAHAGAIRKSIASLAGACARSPQPPETESAESRSRLQIRETIPPRAGARYAPVN
jgi:hypothetical protein